jgi:hypothetical protein
MSTYAQLSESLFTTEELPEVEIPEFNKQLYLAQPTTKPFVPETSFSSLVSDNFNSQIDMLLNASYRIPFTADIFGDTTADEGFNVYDYKEEIDPNHWPEVQTAVSLEHMRFMQQYKVAEEERYNRYQHSSWSTALLAMPFDMYNAIPGVAALKSTGMVASIGNAALSNFLVSGGEEAIRHYGGVNASIEASALNITAATAFGGLIGGSVDLGKSLHRNYWVDAKRNNRHNQVQIEVLANLQELAANGPAIKAANRDVKTLEGVKISDLEDIEINDYIISLTKRIDGLQKGIKQNTLLLEKGVSKDGLPLSDKAIEYANRDIANMEKGTIEASVEKQKFLDESALRLIDRSTVDGYVDLHRLKASAWNPLPSPFKTLMLLDPIKDVKDGKPIWHGLNMLKDSMMRISGDGGRLTEGNVLGFANPQSVYTLSNMEKRHWKQVMTVRRETYAEHTNATKVEIMGLNHTSMMRRVSGSGPTLEQFGREALRKRANGEAGESAAEARFITEIDNFYSMWGERLDQTDLTGNRARVEQEIRFLEIDRDRINERLDLPFDPITGQDPLPPRTRRYFEQRLEDNLEEAALYKSALEIINAGTSRGQTREPFFNRIWDIEKMRANPAEIKRILKEYFAQEGSIPHYDRKKKLFVRKKVSAKNIDENVDNIYNAIVNDPDPLNPDMISGLQDSLRLAHRMIDIPNAKVFDFIHTDPIMIMQNYTNRVAPDYHFSKMFDGKAPSKVWSDIEDQLRVDGYSDDWINKARLNWVTLQRRVMGTVYDDPTSMSIKRATLLKQVTNLNYLTTSGLASFADFARIIMDHEKMDVLAMTLNVFTNRATRAAMREFGDNFGESLEMYNGSVQNRVSDSLTNNVQAGGLWNNIQQAGHIMNGLGPITQFFKQFEGGLRAHKLLKVSKAMADGSATQFEIEYAARHGLTIAMMKEIVAKAPIQETKNGQLLPNINEWTTYSQNRVSQETTEAFRAAVNQGVLNTIVSATPNDRPMIADGIVYLRTSTAKMIPWASKLPEDGTMKGYVKIESGYMTLPFQFYSFMFASMNKVTAAYTSGAVLNRVSGVTAAMGLGYLSAYAKIPDYIWDEMSARDRMLRAFDYSGLGSLYSGVIYDSMQQQLALNQEPFLSKHLGIEPKFRPNYEKQNLPAWVDSATGVLGAGTSTLQDAAEAMTHFGVPLLGDDTEYKKGFLGLYNILPLTGTLPIKAMTDQLGDAFGYKNY